MGQNRDAFGAFWGRVRHFGTFLRPYPFGGQPGAGSGLGEIVRWPSPGGEQPGGGAVRGRYIKAIREQGRVSTAYCQLLEGSGIGHLALRHLSKRGGSSVQGEPLFKGSRPGLRCRYPRRYPGDEANRLPPKTPPPDGWRCRRCRRRNWRSASYRRSRTAGTVPDSPASGWWHPDRRPVPATPDD